MTDGNSHIAVDRLAFGPTMKWRRLVAYAWIFVGICCGVSLLVPLPMIVGWRQNGTAFNAAMGYAIGIYAILSIPARVLFLLLRRQPRDATKADVVWARIMWVLNVLAFALWLLCGVVVYKIRWSGTATPEDIAAFSPRYMSAIWTFFWVGLAALVTLQCLRSVVRYRRSRALDAAKPPEVISEGAHAVG